MIKKILIKDKQNIYAAMQMLQKTAEQCLIVINSKNKYEGTITDGDIRRYILNGNNLDDSIREVYNKNSFYFSDDDFNLDKIKKLILKKNLPLIPIVNKDGYPIEYYNRDNLEGENIKKSPLKKLNVPVVIMAGGKGTRLKPFSQVLPKPLIPINDKTLIEHVIDRFQLSGMSKLFLTINYKSRIIKSFFNELDKDYKISFIKEDKELGTAGGLSMLTNRIKKPFFVSNCDTIIEEDYKKIYEFHIKEKNHITLVAAMKKYIIPFGICEVHKNGQLKNIKEKPKSNYLINTGMYVVNHDVLKFIPKNKKYDFTDFVDQLIKKKKKVGVFPIVEDLWIDVGQWPEYKKSIRLL
jgi:dTDP-glucose pyrophosphorylase